mgnify:CR=1 FL=1
MSSRKLNRGRNRRNKASKRRLKLFGPFADRTPGQKRGRRPIQIMGSGSEDEA